MNEHSEGLKCSRKSTRTGFGLGSVSSCCVNLNMDLGLSEPLFLNEAGSPN